MALIKLKFLKKVGNAIGGIVKGVGKSLPVVSSVIAGVEGGIDAAAGHREAKASAPTRGGLLSQIIGPAKDAIATERANSKAAGILIPAVLVGAFILLARGKK